MRWVTSTSAIWTSSYYYSASTLCALFPACPWGYSIFLWPYFKREGRGQVRGLPHMSKYICPMSLVTILFVATRYPIPASANRISLSLSTSARFWILGEGEEHLKSTCKAIARALLTWGIQVIGMRTYAWMRAWREWVHKAIAKASSFAPSSSSIFLLHLLLLPVCYTIC